MTKANFEKKLNRNKNVRNTKAYFLYKGVQHLKREFIKSYDPIKYDRCKLRQALKSDI